MKTILFSILGIICLAAIIALGIAIGSWIGYIAGLVGDLVRMVIGS